MRNFFEYPEALKSPGSPELMEDLLQGRDCRVERIVSWGQATPEGEWYDQELDEWVLVLEGEALLECRGRGQGRERVRLGRGDSLFLPGTCGTGCWKPAAPASGWPCMAIYHCRPAERNEKAPRLTRGAFRSIRSLRCRQRRLFTCATAGKPWGCAGGSC